MSEAPPASATSSSSAIKPKVSTSKSETSSINGEISKSGNDESSQGEQPQDGSKENQQNSTKNKKKKGKIKSVSFKKPVEISSTHEISTGFLKETDFRGGHGE